MSQNPRELMETVFKRVEFLEALDESPSDKRDLVDRIDVSRSTVNRAVWDLERLGLIEYGTDGYHVSVSGRLLYEQYVQYRNDAEAVMAASDLLHLLPKDAPIDIDPLRGADVLVAEDPAPHFPVTVLSEIIRESRSLYGFSRTHAAPETVDALHNAITDGATAEIVFREAVYDHVRDAYGWIVDQIDDGRLQPYLLDDVPYGLVIAEQVDQTYSCLVFYNENSSIGGVLVNERNAAVDWATNVYDSYRQRAQPVAELDGE